MNDQADPVEDRGDTAPLGRASLHDEVVERLRDLIVEGALEPGARVPERELCARFAVSRTPLREALHPARVLKDALR